MRAFRSFPRSFPHLWIDAVDAGGALTETAEALWRGALERISAGVISPGAKPWIEGTRALELSGDTIVLAVPSAFAKQWLEDHYAGALADALGDAAGRPMGMQVKIDTSRPAEIANVSGVARRSPYFGPK